MNYHGVSNSNFKPRPPLDTPGLTAHERDIVKLAGILVVEDLAKALGVGRSTIQATLTRARRKWEAYQFMSQELKGAPDVRVRGLL